jgi:hypothetical protein
MDLIDFIRLGNEEPTLRFLIIGGYAVAAHGHTRATFDVDFLVRRDDHDSWFLRIAAAGLKLFGETNAFAQFSQEGGGDGLDLMFVDEPTFEQIWQASEERDFGGRRARIPCLDHLLALKLHALKQARPHRTSKDAEDLEILIRRNGLDLSEPRYEQLFLKYGTEKCTKLSSGSCEIHDAPSAPNLDLHLPDGEGFKPLPPRVSLGQMIRRSHQLREWFPGGLRSPQERWLAKTTHEFQL